jgi:DNA topoisomerase-1
MRCVGSADVNDYLRELSGADFTAKDFRTWHASALALQLLCGLSAAGPVSRQLANEVLRQVAARLGNTLAVCRKAYVHPALMSTAAQTGLGDWAGREVPRRRGLSADECRLLVFLSPRKAGEKKAGEKKRAARAR